MKIMSSGSVFTLQIFWEGGVNLNRTEKGILVEELHEKLTGASGSFIIEYKGLNVEASNVLRANLSKSGAELQVVKNRLLKLAVDGTESSSLYDYMKGPSAIVVASDDVVGVAKALTEFAKTNTSLIVKAGQISGKVIDNEGVKRLADLPGRDVLLAQVLSAMQAVPTSLVSVLSGVPRKFLYMLKALEEKKAA